VEGRHTEAQEQRQFGDVTYSRTSNQASYQRAACAAFSHPDCHRRLWILTGIHLHS